MQYRNLGGSGLKVPALTLGTATFGGGTEFFKKWGTTDVAEATSLVDTSLDMGCNMFDTADAYSRGLSEEITAGASTSLYSASTFAGSLPAAPIGLGARAASWSGATPWSSGTGSSASRSRMYANTRSAMPWVRAS